MSVGMPLPMHRWAGVEANSWPLVCFEDAFRSRGISPGGWLMHFNGFGPSLYLRSRSSRQKVSRIECGLSSVANLSQVPGGWLDMAEMRRPLESSDGSLVRTGTKPESSMDTSSICASPLPWSENLVRVVHLPTCFARPIFVEQKSSLGLGYWKTGMEVPFMD